MTFIQVSSNHLDSVKVMFLKQNYWLVGAFKEGDSMVSTTTLTVSVRGQKGVSRRELLGPQIIENDYQEAVSLTLWE